MEKKIGEVRVSKFKANVVALAMTFVIAAPLFALAFSLPHFKEFTPHYLFILLFMLFFLAFLHELLHAFAYIYWGGVERRGLKIGFHWKALMPYCFCKVPVKMRVFRISVLLPLYVTGGLCFIALLIYPSILTAALATLSISSCLGDIWVFIKAGKFPAEAFVKDHPSEVGFDVYDHLPPDSWMP